MNNEKFGFAATSKAKPVNYLRPAIIKVWLAAFLLVLGANLQINAELTPQAAYDWLERRVALLDQLARNDYAVEVISLTSDNRDTERQPVQPESPATDQSSVLGSFLGENNEADFRQTHSGIVAGSGIVVADPPPLSVGEMTTRDIDRLVMQNIQNVIDAGWLKQSSLFVDNSRTIINTYNSIGDEVSGATEGSILFTSLEGSTPVMAQDNANFFWDNTNNRLGIGDANPVAQLVVGSDVSAGAANGLGDVYIQNDLEVDGTIYGNINGTMNPGLTAGSILFQGASGLTQDNASFFWDDTNNRLGIGTASPASKLHVYESANTDVGLTVETTGAGATPFLTLKSLSTRDGDIFWNDGANAGRINYSHSTNDFTFFTNGALSTPAMTIASSRAVTLNSTLTTGDNITINRTSSYPSIFFQNSSVEQSRFDSGLEGTNGAYLALFTKLDGGSSTEKLRITAAGNVGIGTASPSAKLHVLGTTEQLRLGYDASNYWTSTVGSTGGLTLQGVGAGGSLTLQPTAGQNVNINLSGTGDLAVNTNQLYVNTSSGSIGIATASPASLLHIRKDQNGITNLRIDNNSAGSSALSGIQFRNGSLGSDDSFTFNLYGDNYSDTAFLQDSAYIEAGSNTGGGLKVFASGDITFGFGAPSSTNAKLTIDYPSGRVGIGTINPTSKLHILGTHSFDAPGVSGLNVDAHTATLTISPATFRASEIGAMTLVASSAQTVTTASSLYVATPVAGSNVTITNNKPIDTQTTAYLSSGGTWTNASSRELKENFTAVDSQEILDKIDTLKIERWNYKAEENALMHIGPVAGEFNAAFQTGGRDGNKTISTIDPAGIALVGIQGLSARVKEMLDFSWIIEAFKKFGVEISEEIIKISSLAVEKLQVGTVDKPSGIVLYDQATKQPYCVAIENGEFVKALGDCERAHVPETPAERQTIKEPIQGLAPSTLTEKELIQE